VESTERLSQKTMEQSSIFAAEHLDFWFH